MTYYKKIFDDCEIISINITKHTLDSLEVVYKKEITASDCSYITEEYNENGLLISQTYLTNPYRDNDLTTLMSDDNFFIYQMKDINIISKLISENEKEIEKYKHFIELQKLEIDRLKSI